MWTDIYEFMNNRKWSDNVFTTDERIECTIFIQITQQIAADEFVGTLQVQLNRPVFNSSYNSPVLNLKDNGIRNSSMLSFRRSNYYLRVPIDPLTNILAFYANIILGFDFDTFSPLGGTPYFQKARDIVNRSQNATEKGGLPPKESTTCSLVNRKSYKYSLRTISRFALPLSQVGTRYNG